METLTKKEMEEHVCHKCKHFNSGFYQFVTEPEYQPYCENEQFDYYFGDISCPLHGKETEAGTSE